MIIEKYYWKNLVFDHVVSADTNEIFKENLKRDQYKLDIQPNDVLLDIGANIGTVSLRAARKCKHVIAVEPAPANFELLRTNVIQNGIQNVTIINSAVSCHNSVLNIYLSNLYGHHSTIKRRGRTRIQVSAVNINDLLEKYKPNKIKMDCEYSEYSIIPNIKSFAGIDKMSIEFHFKHDRIPSSGKIERWVAEYQRCLSILKENFNVCNCNKFTGKQWQTLERFSK